MKKLPNGISNYEELITENYIYVDKTPYIEKLEELSDKRIMFLRPRKFGKTLFTSTLECYYDKLKEDKFEELFKNTYIGKNPTPNKNRYCVLRFNFSGIDTTNYETTTSGFKKEVATSINVFVKKYSLDFNVNYEDEAERIIDDLIKSFIIQKSNEKMYIMIDEYDHFANEFQDLEQKNLENCYQKTEK